jgi:SNF2 family DNA or RNA helicase
MSKRKTNLCFPSSSDDSGDEDDKKRPKSFIFQNKKIITSENILNSIKTENKYDSSSNNSSSCCSDEDEIKESKNISKKSINVTSSDLSPQISLSNNSSLSSSTSSVIRNSKLTLGDLRKKKEYESIFLQKYNINNNNNNNIKNEKSIPKNKSINSKQHIITKTSNSISDDDKKENNEMIDDDDDDEWMDNCKIISEEQTKPNINSNASKESVSSSSSSSSSSKSNSNNISQKNREYNKNSTRCIEEKCNDEDGFDWLNYHPNLLNTNRDEEKLILESNNEDISDSQVNQYANRYLMDHQVFGVKWLWSKYCASTGCILGDDMGMGKTVQVAALFLAIYEKHGTNEDKINLKIHRDLNVNDKRGKFKPCLVLCPSSVVDNWYKELNTWGHFSIASMNNGSNGAIEKVERNEVEILIGSYHKFTNNANRLSKISWNVTVFDEGHQMKNIKTNTYKAAMSLTRTRSCIMLTGTPIQNTSKELWSLLSLIDHNFMNKKDFDSYYATPIERSMNNNAAKECIDMGNKRKKELQRLLKTYHIARKKESLTGTNALKGKDDVIVMCDLSPLQQLLMKEVLLLPDVILVKEKRTHEIPTIIDSNGYTIINPKAVLWKQSHSNDESCERCPSCIQFPIITKLLHICSHPSLLQVIIINAISNLFINYLKFVII